MNMCTQYQVDIFKNDWDMTKHVKKQALFTSFWDITVIFRILLFDQFWRFKSVKGHFSRSLRKSDLKHVSLF